MRRLKSLDALRGFDMFWIAGGEQVIHSIRKFSDAGIVVFLDTQFLHRDWEGLTFYDLIFPLFLFIVGVSLVFSLNKTLDEKGGRATFVRIVRRSLLLYILGVIFSSGSLTSIEEIRLMGVLQRIAISYFVTGILYIKLRPRGLVLACIVLLVGYWALMTFVPVPGIGAGNFQEGTNLANYIDKHYLPLHKYDGDHDPEGLLSTLPAISTCLLGVFAGFSSLQLPIFSNLIKSSSNFSDQTYISHIFNVIIFNQFMLGKIKFKITFNVQSSSFIHGDKT